eukprot:Sspe_Gene.97090::Locus_70747_Transcript_1_1_Confidence_1.000_Length_1007::g.97090::m.97090
MGNTNVVDIDKRYMVPQGLYPTCQWDHRLIRRAIATRKLAPCYPGEPEKLPGREECPICFLWYQGGLNRSACCRQSICTECFLQVRPMTAGGGMGSCPFCNHKPYQVNYTGVRTARERMLEEIEEQKVIALQIKMQKEAGRSSSPQPTREDSPSPDPVVELHTSTTPLTNTEATTFVSFPPGAGRRSRSQCPNSPVSCTSSPVREAGQLQSPASGIRDGEHTRHITRQHIATSEDFNSSIDAWTRHLSQQRSKSPPSSVLLQCGEVRLGSVENGPCDASPAADLPVAISPPTLATPTRG